MNARNRLEGQRASPSFERLNGEGRGGNTHVSCQLTPSRPFLFKMLSRLILGRTRKFIHPPWYKLGGGVDWTPPKSFWCVAVFRNNFAFSGKPLIFWTRWGIFYGLWGCWRPVTWILSRIRNQVKIAINGNFFAWHVKKNINKHLAWFHPQVLLLLLKKVEKTYIFTKIKWLNHLLLITSYLVTIVIDHH